MNMTTKWMIAGVLYLGLVIGGYYSYVAVTGAPDPVHENHGSAQEDTKDHGGHEHHDMTAGESEVSPSITAEGNELTITLKDKEGNPLSEKDLEVNHERLLHLIVVSQDLQQYEHLHPRLVKNGVFEVKASLPAGSYQAFVDIKPKQLAYEVEPLSFQVGEKKGKHADLKPDDDFTQTVRETTVTMRPTSLQAGKPVTLNFSLQGGKPEPYLGALGHVVILDEGAEKFIHVHPVSDEETRFTTTFEQPGIYKIWGEFKVDGEVKVYPFVVEVK
ncbi:hypothetical protein [Desmospora activa]|uniref:Secreted protein n=1 Tax=Desmospora activa DSM 45169 TaxID=1121389 RepID=A0A2T4Z9P8_9BACL|nr:hypothetical protein [Desmospora activa]PTM58616.1 hypothetical protein C8J48_1201 [Desmospora activa DSM 45169]